jgi:DNA-binding response OmpR family regulator
MSKPSKSDSISVFESPGSCLAGVKILLVEDEPDIADLLTLLLKANGAEIITATYAESALPLLEKYHPDLLLCNVRLPHKDGNWLIEQLRHHSSGFLQGLPAIAITSYTRDVSEFKALDSGFDRFVAKDSDLDALIETIVNLLKSNSANGQV